MNYFKWLLPPVLPLLPALLLSVAGIAHADANADANMDANADAGQNANADANATDHVFDRQIQADPRGTVEISNVAGKIYVSGWDNSQVDVHAELGSGVERVDVESDHGRTSVKVVVPNHSFRSIHTKLRVRVPRQSEIDISGVSADIDVRGVQGPLQLKTVSGDVSSDVFQSNTEVKTVSGDVDLHGSGQNLNVHVSSVSGSVKMTGGAGDVESTTVSGDTHVRLDSAKTVRAHTTSGNFSLEGKVAPGGLVEAEAVSGDVRVKAAPAAAYDYEVTTFSGDITNCFGATPQRKSKYAPGERLNGTRGEGNADGARVRVKTMSGDVELCDKN